MADLGMIAVEARSLIVRAGNQQIITVDHLRFQFESIHLIKGLSGSGKSTLLHALAGLVAYQGSLEVDEAICAASTVVVLDRPGLDRSSTPSSEFRYEASLSSGRGAPSRSSWRRLVAAFGIENLLHRRVRTLSRGEVQRVRLSMALARKPRLLILDEPDTGLDAEQCRVLSGELQSAAEEGCCVVLSSHSTVFDSVATESLRMVDGRPIVRQLDSLNLYEGSLDKT